MLPFCWASHLMKFYGEFVEKSVNKFVTVVVNINVTKYLERSPTSTFALVSWQRDPHITTTVAYFCSLSCGELGICWIQQVLQKHDRLLPKTFCAAFWRSNRRGKRNALLSLIFHENGIRSENFYVYSESLDQPKDHFLQEVHEVSYHPFKDNDEVNNLYLYSMNGHVLKKTKSGTNVPCVNIKPSTQLPFDKSTTKYPNNW